MQERLILVLSGNNLPLNLLMIQTLEMLVGWHQEDLQQLVILSVEVHNYSVDSKTLEAKHKLPSYSQIFQLMLT